VEASWGDIYVPAPLMNCTEQELVSDIANRNYLFSYLYHEPDERMIREAAIYDLINRWNPDIIVDSVNTATVLGSKHNPYKDVHQFLDDSETEHNVDDLIGKINELLLHAFVPKQIRFVQALQAALTDCQVRTYIKVSTTGLGGMGANIRYTHGDKLTSNLSFDLLGKVSAAGVFHQLLWTLSHTPGTDIRVIVPATLVGWEDCRVTEVRSPGGEVHAVDCDDPVVLYQGQSLERFKLRHSGRKIRMPVVSSGENRDYSLMEMTTITALGQMGSITKEEVAEAVINELKGPTTKNLLTAMDNACLGPSYAGFANREVALSRLRDLEASSGIPSIATGNLGPTVAKHLFELHILKEAVGGDLDVLLNTDPGALTDACHQVIAADRALREQILSIGIPILINEDEALIGSHWIIPGKDEEQLISPQNLHEWAQRGWVDLRCEQVQHWQQVIQMVIEDARMRKVIPVLHLTNAHAINADFNIGEYLAYYYTITGGGRHISEMTYSPMQNGLLAEVG